MNESATRRFAVEVRKSFALGGYSQALDDHYMIRDKQARIIPFRANWAQRDFLGKLERQVEERGCAKMLVLKARQLGMSTLSQGINMVQLARRAYNMGLTLSHESESSRYLFSMMNLAIKLWRDGPDLHDELESARMSGLVFGEPLHSMAEVATAGNAGSGRSRTIQFLHASECAFYPDPDTLMLGMMQAVPDDGGICVLESTANGTGNWFHRQWQAAIQGDSEYEPCFYPWHMHPEYQRPFLDEDEEESFSKALSRTESELHEEHGVGLQALRWRRYAVANKCGNDPQRFKQEYPTYPEEAFLTSGRPVFNAEQLGRLLKRCRETEPVRRGMLEPVDWKFSDLPAEAYD